MIEEETDTLPFSPVSTVDLQYEEDANLINGTVPPMANRVPLPTAPVSPRVVNIVPPTLPSHDCHTYQYSTALQVTVRHVV